MKNQLNLIRVLALSLLVAVACSACNTVTPDQMNTALANAATLIANGCKVVQPALSTAGTTSGNPDVNLAAAGNGVFCAAETALATPLPQSPVPASAVSITPSK